MIKVLIVDDSPLMRKILGDILRGDKDIHIVGEAKNGKEALYKIPLLKPDLITLDIEMPIMDGITALEKIVKLYNLPVVMISSLTMEGAALTLDALDKGAVDFIQKPKNIFSMNKEQIKLEIIDKIKMAAKSKVNIEYRIKALKPFKDYSRIVKDREGKFEYIVAIGTSTGGPRALQAVLPLFPENINASFVIVQHMPPKFTKSLADRLDTLSNIRVKEGENGEVLQQGYCYIAPGDFHMKVVEKEGDYIIELNKEPAIKGLRPAVDVLMESVAKLRDLKKIGVIMTGMGSDGANGVTNLKKNNGYIIAQNQETSVVFGMPKAAIDTGYVDRVVPLSDIAYEVMKKMGV